MIIWLFEYWCNFFHSFPHPLTLVFALITVINTTIHSNIKSNLTVQELLTIHNKPDSPEKLGCCSWRKEKDCFWNMSVFFFLFLQKTKKSVWAWNILSLCCIQFKIQSKGVFKSLHSIVFAVHGVPAFLELWLYRTFVCELHFVKSVYAWVIFWSSKCKVNAP